MSNYMPLLIILLGGLALLWVLSARKPTGRPPVDRTGTPDAPLPPATGAVDSGPVSLGSRLAAPAPPRKQRQLVLEFSPDAPGSRAQPLVLTDPVVIQLGRARPSLTDITFVQLKGDDISKEHGLITYREKTKTYELTYHPGASSPIILNGTVIERNIPATLEDGAVIQFGGRVKVTVRLPDGAPGQPGKRKTDDWIHDLDD